MAGSFSLSTQVPFPDEREPKTCTSLTAIWKDSVIFYFDKKRGEGQSCSQLGKLVLSCLCGPKAVPLRM